MDKLYKYRFCLRLDGTVRDNITYIFEEFDCKERKKTFLVNIDGKNHIIKKENVNLLVYRMFDSETTEFFFTTDLNNKEEVLNILQDAICKMLEASLANLKEKEVYLKEQLHEFQNSLLKKVEL